MKWDNKQTVILNTLSGVACKCHPNLQWLKRSIEHIVHLNGMGYVPLVGDKFIKSMEGIAHDIKFKKAS